MEDWMLGRELYIRWWIGWITIDYIITKIIIIAVIIIVIIIVVVEYLIIIDH